MNIDTLKNALETIDMGILLGAPLEKNVNFLTNVAQLLTNELKEHENVTNIVTPTVHEKEISLKRKLDNTKYQQLIATEVDTSHLPSLEYFLNNYLIVTKPLKILGNIKL